MKFGTLCFENITTAFVFWATMEEQELDLPSLQKQLKNWTKYMKQQFSRR